LDLVQGFFAEILENSPLQRVDPARGPLRAYMLGALKNYLSHQRDRDQAQKRRADRPKYQVSLDDAESAYRLEVQAVGGAEGDAESDPATAYDRRWALAVFDRALTALKRDYESSGRSTQFDRLQGYLSGEDETTYRDAADELGMTEGAIKVAVHRLRGRLGHFLREEVAQTVARQGDVDEELRYLLQVM
jgi:RNA polymerase sigma-70 factor (ECF subfamily)